MNSTQVRVLYLSINKSGETGVSSIYPTGVDRGFRACMLRLLTTSSEGRTVKISKWLYLLSA